MNVSGLKPVCIIPARGGSKRLPRKNIIELCGKPLLAYAVEAALDSGVFGRVCVSSEDAEILDCARQWGAEPLTRLPDLADDCVQIRHVVAAHLEEFSQQGQEYEDFGVTLTTNPLRSSEHIRRAYRLFRENDCNGVMSLVEVTHPPQRAVWAPRGWVEPYFSREYMKQTQLLDPTYRHDGAIFFGRTEAFLDELEFYGTRIMPFHIPPEQSVDIDSAEDLLLAEVRLKARSRTE